MENLDAPGRMTMRTGQHIVNAISKLMRDNDRSQWRQLDDLPVHGTDDWAIWSGRTKEKCAGVHQVEASVERWLPASSMLVGVPGADRFVPPICVERFRNKIVRTVGRNSKSLITVFAAFGTILIVTAVIVSSLKSLALAAVMMTMAATFAGDYCIGLRRESGILERALFIYWLKSGKRGRTGLVLWASIGLVIGCVQMFAQRELGGMAALFHEYGMMYPSVRAGELWRLVTGPYLHYSIMHFATNFALLLFVGWITWASIGIPALVVFAFANIVAAAAQMLVGGQVYDSFGGISGGVYALFALLVTHGAIDRRLLPKGFAVLCTGLALVGIGSSELLSESSATVAHVTGFIVGALCAGLLNAGGRFMRQLRALCPTSTWKRF